MKLTLLENDEPESSTPKEPKPAKAKKAKGKSGAQKTKFHGAFSSASDAEAKSKKIPGSFIKPIKVRGQTRYAVIERKE